MKTTPWIVLGLAASLKIMAAEAPNAPNAPTALKSLKNLPAGAASRLAIIDGHDGAPTPTRWHFLVEDPAAENGLREFVVADRELVANREVSQFAEALRPEDVLPKAAIKIDSDAVARIAQRYAAANAVPVASMNYRLRKDDLTDIPVWTVSCQDGQGNAVASLVIQSRDGRVLTHEGFPVAPPAAAPTPLSAVKGQIASKSVRSRRADGDPRPPPVFQGPENDRRVPVRRAEPVRRDRPSTPEPGRDLLQPVRRLIDRLLPF